MRKVLLALACAVFIVQLTPAPARAAITAGNVVISEVYGGGGNTQPTYSNDYVELFNRTRSRIDLTGWKLEYSSVSSTAWTAVPLRGPVNAYHFYLVKLGGGGGGGAPMPKTPDATGTPNLARTGGELRITNSAGVIDTVGWGSSATVYEGGRAPAASDNTHSVARYPNGCQDTNRNDRDFKLRTPEPRNNATPGIACGSAPVLASIGAKSVTANDKLTFTVSATDPDGDPVTYSASNLPATATFTASTRTFSWTPKNSDVGSYPGVTFTASDGWKKDSEAITITVKEDAGAGGGSSITVVAQQRVRRIVATGHVSPSHPGDSVVVRLFRRVGTTYQRVGSVRAPLDSASNYKAWFERPAPGACRVAAKFLGDDDTTESTAEADVNC